MNAAGTSRTSLHLAALLVGLTVVRAWFAATTELTPDEAYYWAWSTRLSTGYFDHGPLVAWLVRLGTLLFGRTELGVRLGALLCSLVTAWMVYLLANRMVSSQRQAFWVVVLLSATPLFSVGAVVHTPDAALAACWTVSLWFGVRAIRSERLGDWAGMGVAAGFAILAKFTGVLLLGGMALFLTSSKLGRQRLRSPGPAVALLAAAAVSLPNHIWNLGHAGGSFAFQWQHATGDVGFSPASLLAFLGGQAGVVSPLLWLGAVVFMIMCFRRAIRFGLPDVFLLWCMSAPFLALFTLLSLFHKVEANWPAVLYLSAVPALAWMWRGGCWYLKRIRAWTAATLVLAAVPTLLIHIQALVPWVPLDPRQDPTARLRGWHDLAEEALSEARALGAELATEGYGPVSELRFYTGTRVHYEPNAARLSQYDLWDEDLPTGTVLVLQPRTTPTPPRLCEDATERWEILHEGEEEGDRRARDFRWWVCERSAHGK